MTDIVERLLEEITQCALELEEAANVFDGTNFPGLARIYRASSTRARAALAQQPLSVLEEWRPIAEADNGIAHIIDAAGLHIGNSLPIWARDIDGRVFECLWADDGKRAYWWDIEGESPVDPVEFMPHPLAAFKATGGAPE